MTSKPIGTAASNPTFHMNHDERKALIRAKIDQTVRASLAVSSAFFSEPISVIPSMPAGAKHPSGR
ncbi:hypothetical protein BS627_03055 [Agrobacterium salinitolerans]|nr:hypothetical protein BS627_03055 [Agrobacterium salinitolerans]PNQ25614.1 hypothetical protein C2E26_03115 [Rhizobium sp. YIC5082]